MSRRSGGFVRLGIGALALAGLAFVVVQPAAAQSRTLASLGDVPVFVPAPYHPHNVTANYSAALYDEHGDYGGGGAHYWH